MPVVYLEALNIAVRESKLTYHYEGVVSSIEERIKDLNKLYDTPNEELYVGPNVFGNTSERKGNVHVFHLERDEMDTICTLAHEETHFLQLIGKTDLVERKLKQRYNVLVVMDWIKNEHVAAYVGSILALMERGYDDKAMLDRYGHIPNFKKAYDICHRGKNSILRRSLARLLSA